MDVSLVLVTVLLEGMEKWSDQSATHAATDVKHLKKTKTTGYLQLSEVYVVPQTVVVDVKQSVLIGYVSAREYRRRYLFLVK